MSFGLDNKLIYIDSFQFLSSSLDSLVKNSGENDFKHLRIKNLIVKYTQSSKKDFIPINIFLVLRTLPTKNEFYSSIIGKGINDKEYQHALKVSNQFEMKR